MVGAVRANEILDATLARAGTGAASVRIIGVDGPAGSGKSTLARELAEAAAARLGVAVPVICIDDFVGWTDLDAEARTWWPRLEAEVLAPLERGRDLAWRRRDWLGDPEGLGLLPEPASAEWAPLAILEGVSVTRAAAAGRLAFAVWVEAPRELRLARGVERDGEQERAHLLAWQQLEDEFFASDGTRDRADVVLATG